MLGIDNNTVLMLHAEDFKDSSYSPKTVTNNGVTISGGKFDNAFVFNGTSSYLEINNIDLQSLLSNNFTIEFFVNMTSRNKSYPTPLSIASASATANRSVWIHFNSNSTEFNFGNGTSSSVKITTSAISLNRWYHIAIVKDGNLFKVFMDGNLIDSATVNNFYSPSSSNFYFGTLYASDTSTLFNGLIDEVRVSNVARWNSNFTPPTKPYEGEPTINIISKTREVIEFSVEHSNINKVDVLVNGNKKQSFSSNYDNLIFNIDNNDPSYVKGENIIKIKVTYNTDLVYELDIKHYIYITEDASLKEVMDEFEKLSLMGLTNIDVIVSSELPSTVKNGRIVLISDKYNNVYISEEEPSMDNNDIWIKKNDDGIEFKVSSKNVVLNSKIYGAVKKVNSETEPIASYIGVDGEWIYMGSYYLFKENKGNSYSHLYDVKISDPGISNINIGNDKISLGFNFYDMASGKSTLKLTSKNLIDLSMYNRFYFDFDSNCKSNYGTFTVRLIDESKSTVASYKVGLNESRNLRSIDVSKVNVRCKFEVYCELSTSGGYGSVSRNMNLYNIYFE